MFGFLERENWALGGGRPRRPGGMAGYPLTAGLNGAGELISKEMWSL